MDPTVLSGVDGGGWDGHVLWTMDGYMGGSVIVRFLLLMLSDVRF